MQPAPFLIFIIDSRSWIVKHKNIAILASQIPLPAPCGHRSCGVAFCQFLWYPLSRKALSNQTQAAIAPHRSRCLALRSKASAGGQLFGVPLPTLTAKGGMPYDYIGNSIAFPDDHRTVGTSRKCCTSDGRPEKDDSYGSKRKKHKKK